MISSKHIYENNQTSRLINISFTYTRAAICIQGWLKCYMPLV